MSTLIDDLFTYLKEDELRLECIVRNINTKATDAFEKLRNCFILETSKISQPPFHTHVGPTDVGTELKECVNTADYLGKTTKLMKIAETDKEEVRPLLVKAKHYGDRLLRVKNSFGDREGLITLENRFRRQISFLSDIISYSIQVDELNKSLGRTSGLNLSSTPNGAASEVKAATSENVTTTISPMSSPLVSTQNSTIDSVVSTPGDGSTLSMVTGNVFTASSMAPTQSTVMYGFVNPKVSASVNNSEVSNPNVSSLASLDTLLQNYSNINYPSVSNNSRQNNIPQNTAPQNNFQEIRVINDPRFNDNRYVPKWNITYDGSDGLEVNDFIYRIEETANRENFPFEQIPRILPHFLKGKASDWLWTYMRTHPRSLWNDIRQAMLSRFCCYETEFETRNMIQRSIQNTDESINDFVLKIESYNSKLINNRFSERELVEILRNNMKASLQNATLLVEFQTVEQLRSVCAKYERLWLKSRQQNRYPITTPIIARPRQMVNEVSYPIMQSNYYTECPFDYPVNEFSNVQISEVQAHTIPNETPIICQIQSRQTSSANMSVTCWNCKIVGHTYFECLQPLKEFCYGCGQSEVRLPNCPKCKDKWFKRHSGNAKPSGVKAGENCSVPAIQAPAQKSTEDAASNTEPYRYR